MEKQSGGSVFDFMGNLAGFSRFNGQVLRLAVWPIEICLRWQEELLKVAAPAAAEWFVRRREGTEAALKALGQLTACEDLQAAAKLQSDWVENEAKRLEADARAWSAQAFYWPRETAGVPSHSVERAPAARPRAQHQTVA